MPGENSESAKSPGRGAWTAAAAAVAIGLAVLWTNGMSRASGMGWDESMHAELPALRMLLSLKAGELRGALDALLGCSPYPFVYPCVLAAAQTVFGAGESVCRATGTAVWCAGLFGLHLLGREAARGTGDRGLAAWATMAIGALSPMALAFSGTLFLEVPFACASIFALRAWMRRSARPGLAGEVAAGAWLSVCLFTKFNYGLLLSLGLALDLACEAVAAVRAGAGPAFFRSTCALGLVPAAACLWWFLLPLPGGLELGSEHREALLSFLAGNRGFEPTSLARRLLEASAWLTWTPRLFAVLMLCAAATLPLALRPPVRTLWLVLAGMAVPTLSHPFHQDRFLIPIAVPLWALAGVGLGRILPGRKVLRTALLGGLAVLCTVFPARAALRAADLLQPLGDDPKLRAYREEQYRRWPDLSPSRRLPTAGLEREALDSLLDVVAGETGPEERIGWIGVSPELSPAVIHLGLLERGGSRARFLRDASATVDIGNFGADPAWSDEDLARYASRFDVVFATEPSDVKSRPARAWTRAYRERLVDRLGWQVRTVGSVGIQRPMQGTQEVRVLACRPAR